MKKNRKQANPKKLTKFEISKASYYRVVRDIAKKVATTLNSNHLTANNIRFQATALECLQEAGEVYVVQVLEDSKLLAVHAKRITLFPADIQLAMLLRRDFQKK